MGCAYGSLGVHRYAPPPKLCQCAAIQAIRVAAWATLHKDVGLEQSLGVDRQIMLDTATCIIAEMNRRPSGTSAAGA